MQKIQAIKVEIPNGQDTITVTDDLTVGYSKFTGVAVVNSQAGNDVLKSVMFDGKELLPKNTEVALIQSTTNVIPDERFFSVNEKNQNSSIELTIKASNTAGRAYNVYLRLEK